MSLRMGRKEVRFQSEIEIGICGAREDGCFETAGEKGHESRRGQSHVTKEGEPLGKGQDELGSEPPHARADLSVRDRRFKISRSRASGAVTANSSRDRFSDKRCSEGWAHTNISKVTPYWPDQW